MQDDNGFAMMRRLTGVGVIAVLLGSAVLFLSACKDASGEELTLEQYFARVDALDEELMRESDRREQEFEALSEAERLSRAEEFLHGELGVIQYYANELAAVDPPEPVREAHQEAVTGAAAIEEAVSGWVSEVDEAGPFASYAEYSSKVNEIADRMGLSSVFDPYNAACLKLEAIAAYAKISFDIDCD
jgi:hypothetical protein